MRMTTKDYEDSNSKSLMRFIFPITENYPSVVLLFNIMIWLKNILMYYEI